MMHDSEPCGLRAADSPQTVEKNGSSPGHNPLRILLLLPTISLQGEGGPVTHTKELLGNLARKADVDLISAYTKIPKMPIVFILANELLGLVRGSLRILAHRPDVIYSRGSQVIIGTILAGLFRLPYVIEVNGIGTDEAKIVKSRGLYYHLRLWKHRFHGRLASTYVDRIVAVTPGIKQVFEDEWHVPPERITVIENGANTDLFHPMDRAVAESTIGLPPASARVCFVGKFAPWQGIEYLIEAAPVVLAACPGTQFVVVGDGPMKKAWIDRVKALGVGDRFIFPGLVPYARIPLYLNAADLCVAPFTAMRNARMGLSALKVYEYLACGRPVVASRVAGIEELLERSGGGRVAEPEEPGSLASSIVALIGDPAARERMGARGREYVERHHSWCSVADQVIGVCRQSMAEAT